jgi:hypothetical protein
VIVSPRRSSSTSARLRARARGERLALEPRVLLGEHPTAVPAYSAFKAALADAVPDLDSYADIKDPVVDLVIAGAEPWASASSSARTPPPRNWCC